MTLSYLYSKDALTLKFHNSGDVLEMHSHPEWNYHDTLLVEGEAEIYGPDRRWVVRLEKGKVLPLTIEQMEHEIKALTPGAVVMNVYRLPQPQFAAHIGKGWQVL